MTSRESKLLNSLFTLHRSRVVDCQVDITVAISEAGGSGEHRDKAPGRKARRSEINNNEVSQV